MRSGWLMILLVLWIVIIIGIALVLNFMESEQYCSDNSDCIAFSNGCSSIAKCMNSEYLEKNPPKCCELGYCGIVEDVKCKCKLFKCIKE